MNADAPGDSQRLDKWLFFARFAKSRSLAQKFVAAGHVRINGAKAESPARLVRAGDVLTLTLARDVAVLRVEAPGARRGPATEARTLYERLDAGRDAPAT